MTAETLLLNTFFAFWFSFGMGYFFLLIFALVSGIVLYLVSVLTRK